MNWASRELGQDLWIIRHRKFLEKMPTKTRKTKPFSIASRVAAELRLRSLSCIRTDDHQILDAIALQVGMRYVGAREGRARVLRALAYSDLFEKSLINNGTATKIRCFRLKEQTPPEPPAGQP